MRKLSHTNLYRTFVEPFVEPFVMLKTHNVEKDDDCLEDDRTFEGYV